jgi:hypothetical protein
MHNFSHGVNVGECTLSSSNIFDLWADCVTPIALKSEALAYRFTNSQSDIQSTYDRLAMIWKYHGRSNGMFLACNS